MLRTLFIDIFNANRGYYIQFDDVIKQFNTLTNQLLSFPIPSSSYYRSRLEFLINYCLSVPNCQ
uniref:Uncharacterized protein n=1 Tax=Lepeophtheirus salmonis TaxID=72036 RepID=A0A0K2SYW6_LEPSM